MAEPISPRTSHLVPLLAGAGFIIVVVVSLIGWAILQERSDAHRAAELATQNISETLADNLSGTLLRIDLGMQAIIEEIARQQATGRIDDAAIAAAIAREDAKSPDSIGFRVFGPDGRLRLGLKEISDPKGEISGRDDFKVLRDNGDSGMIVTAPMVGVVTHREVIAMGRRISNPDGSFAGVVRSAIFSHTLARVFSDLKLGPGGTVTLYHVSGKIGARFPEQTGSKDPVTTTVISDRLRGILDSGVEVESYDITSPVDGIRRTLTARKVDGAPYYMLVGLAEDDYLSDWRRNSIRYSLFGGFIIVVTLAASIILHRRIRDWQAAVAALAEKSEQLATSNAALAERTELLLQSNADLEQFATVASHDLQTPLRNMIRYAQLLERRYRGQLDADADSFIGFIVDGGKRMAALIDDLLDYSRVGSQAKVLSPVSADQAFSLALRNLAVEIEAVGADIRVGKLPVVLGEESLLVSLFQNLLGNALKYRSPDRAPLVSVTARREGKGLWRIAVADNGIGISPDYHDKIFEIFQRLDPVTHGEGTGIGLTLCRRIVHRFGGTIGVDSAPGEGTTFYVTLRDGSASA